MTHEPTPQQAPARVLAQLFTENPTLPPIDWRLHQDGSLTGTHVIDGSDGADVFAAYQRVLGGSPSKWMYQMDGVTKVTHYLYTTWQGVALSITVLGDAPVGENTAAAGGDGRDAA